MPVKAWASKRLDFSFDDWLFAIWACASPTGEGATERVEALWSPEGQGMVGLSVRSLFDLYLTANRWAPGDRILFTALTVADMPRIARDHGLEVASVDLDPLSTEPDLDALAAAMTPRTRVLVFHPPVWSQSGRVRCHGDGERSWRAVSGRLRRGLRRAGVEGTRDLRPNVVLLRSDQDRHRIPVAVLRGSRIPTSLRA